MVWDVDVVIYTDPCGVAKMIKIVAFCAVLVRDYTYGVTLSVRLGDDGKGPQCSPTVLPCLARFPEATSRCWEPDIKSSDTRVLYGPR